MPIVTNVRSSRNASAEFRVIAISHSFDAESAALIVGHPGHELLVYGWMALAKPVVCVLTDGSGGDRLSRVDKTTGILQSVGARPGPLFGRFPDAEFYARILASDLGFFIAVAEELADALVSSQTTLVVGDAAEGYNSGHDVCRLLIDAAVGLASRRMKRIIGNFAISLVGDPQERTAGSISLALGRDVWRRKIAAARDYAELAGEVDRAAARFGDAAFAVETLLPVEPFALPLGPAYYERFGAERVAAGKYPALIRRNEHLAAIARALAAHARGASPCGASPCGASPCGASPCAA